MLSIFGSLLGFTTSFLPNLMDYFQGRQDNAHEIAMVAAQVDAQVRLEGVKLEAMHAEGAIREIEALHKEQASTIRKGSKWLANLSGSIRPVVTYAFVIEFLVINAMIAYLLIDQQGLTISVLREIMNAEFTAMLSTMLSFWFGNRTFGKRRT